MLERPPPVHSVPVTGQTFGIFSRLHGLSSPGEFANELRAAASTDYGHAGPMQVQAILGYSAEQLRKEHRKIIGCFNTSDAQEIRVADMFGAVALAGEIAARNKIVPWASATTADFSDSDSVNAAVALFNSWIQARDCRSNFPSEHHAILSAINDALERHNDAKFSDFNQPIYINPHNPSVQLPPPIVRDRLGWYDDSSGQRIYMLLSSGLREITKAFDFKRVLTALEQATAFAKKGTDSIAFPTYFPDGRTIRLYYINPEKLSV